MHGFFFPHGARQTVPAHDWGDKTGWRLFNAATFALTDRIFENSRATADLQRIIDGVCEVLH